MRKRIMLTLLSILLIFSSMPVSISTAAIETSDVFAQMLERAEAIVNYEWVPSQRIDVWNKNPYNGKMYFEKGETVKGMPYSLFYNEFGVDSLLSLEQYKRVADINYSDTKYCISVNDMRTGPVYGSCCATFVSEVFGGGFMYGENPRYDNVGGIQRSQYGTTYENATVDQIKLGDALSNTNGGHIVWVGGITDTDITIYEQTPPVARKRTVSKSSVTSEGYLICGYKENGSPDIYNVITRSNELIDPDDDEYPRSEKYPVPIKAYTINTGKTLVYTGIDGNAKLNKIYEDDLCVINRLYENGWCHVTFTLNSGGYETGYVQTSTFFDFDRDVQTIVMPNQIDTYMRSDLQSKIGYIGANDEVYIVGENGSSTQIMYPVDEAYGGGYKIGWIASSNIPQTQHFISYDLNGGSGDMPQSATPGYLSDVVPVRDGFSFLGWSTSSESETPEYYPGSYCSINEDLTLYAVWSEIPVAELVSISVYSLPAKTTYNIGESIDTTGLQLKLNYSDGSSEIISGGFEINGFDSSTSGTKAITVTYEGLSASFGITVIDNTSNVPKYHINNITAAVGKTIEVYVSIENNPGIISLRNTIIYDESVFELTKVEDTGLLKGYTAPYSVIASPYTLRWADSLATVNNASDGNIVKLTFNIKETADSGIYYITVDPIEARNVDGTKIIFASGKSTVTVVDYITGDGDGDGEISDWDAILLNRYLAGWENVELNVFAADIDGDGEVSDWDAIILERYLAGWDVEI